MTADTKTNGISIIDTNAFPEKGMQIYRAPSLLQPHCARQALLDAHTGKIPPLLSTWVGTGSVAVARILAQLGYDMVVIDWEHNALSVETMTEVSACA